VSDHEADARAERKAIYAKRKDFTALFGLFVRTMRDAMTAYLGMRAQGVEREDALKGLETVIRDAWPKPVTKFGPKCETCADTGYEELVCRQWARCERAAPKDCDRRGETFTHPYVVPCLCPSGDKLRKRAFQAPELATVGKVAKKRGGFSRMGS
jgi:hypothetical protein